MTDPRTSIISERLKGIHRIIAVSGGKGGVGKSLTASVMALALVRKGFKVGLFDLDFTSPSTHIILGVTDISPKEENGIIPPEIHGLKYMSITYYSGEHASPLRGADVSNALIELLAIARWNHLDFLIIDMPPGISDTTLDVIRYVKNVEFLIVMTPSHLSFETVKKMINLLSEMRIPVLGVIENMKMKKTDFIQQQILKMGVKYLGEVPFEPKVEEKMGNPKSLETTRFTKKIMKIVEENSELLLR